VVNTEYGTGKLQNSPPTEVSGYGEGLQGKGGQVFQIDSHCIISILLAGVLTADAGKSGEAGATYAAVVRRAWSLPAKHSPAAFVRRLNATT
jgi:hypothetical protein